MFIAYTYFSPRPKGSPYYGDGPQRCPQRGFRLVVGWWDRRSHTDSQFCVCCGVLFTCLGVGPIADGTHPTLEVCVMWYTYTTGKSKE